MDVLVPILVTFCIMVGSVSKVTYGWLMARSEGEAFNVYKLSASIIVAVFGALAAALAMISSSMIVDTAGMVSLCVLALMTGWGLDSAKSEITRLGAKAVKNKK